MSNSAVPKATTATGSPPPKATPKPPLPTIPAQASLPARPGGRMSLDSVIRGRIEKPMRVLVYGVEGVGKSTFAASAPSTIFLGAEDGTSELDVARFPEPSSWVEAMEAITELTNADHDYKTLAIDTLDWLEPLCWMHTFQGKKDKAGKPIENIEGFGFGKGYSYALEHWRQLTAALERLRTKRGMHMVLLAHSWIKPFKNPAGEDFDRYEMKLHAKAAGLMREWSDAVLFAQHETLTYEANGRVKGISSGARVLYTERCAAWDAKNRYDLPDRLPLDWQSFAEAVLERRPADPEQLREKIEGMLVGAREKLAERVRNALQQAGDNAAELARIWNKLNAVVDEAPAAEEAQS